MTMFIFFSLMLAPRTTASEKPATKTVAKRARRVIRTSSAASVRHVAIAKIEVAGPPSVPHRKTRTAITTTIAMA